ncbi:phage baseplate assembly protein V [Paenibacillus glufosinatiresistens]|uniref:phage baseplate assembly protein V n=1 Tax=Paenibacillus glufosinatiresistens TaxID=3070657 RepID=UPI00286DE7F4|nr:phage baseplate assembly protein V [Paenibacillus sp. YX.27]
MIRIGQVSAVNHAAGTVRVAFADRDDAVSADLPVVVPGGGAQGNPLPLPGQTVLCAFTAAGSSAGFCLGTYYGGGEKPPGTEEQRGVWFEDGSYVFYDRKQHSLNVKAAGAVNIEGDLTVTGIVRAASIKEAGE